MASSTFALAIDALVAERDRQFVLRVAQDYNLNFEELNAKYLETAAMAIKVPRKYTKREPKSVTVLEVNEGTVPAKPAKAPKEPKVKQCCTAATSKKEPCKFSALKGEVFCKRHLKQSLGESAPAGEAAPKKVPKAPKKGPEPVHNHLMDAEIHDGCELCESHGNPLATEPQKFEVVTKKTEVFKAPATGPIKVVSVDERLAAMLAEADSEAEESDAEAEEFEAEEAPFELADDGDLGEEEFEDEDDN